MKAVVIGAGIAGLAAAIRLAVQGMDVTVMEKNAGPGGKMSEISSGGYRFDTGPSLFTLPELAEELFTLCGEEMGEHIAYRPLEVSCRYFYPSGEDITFYHDTGKLMRELHHRQVVDPESVLRRLAASREVYDLGAPVFMFSNFHRLSNFNTPAYKKVAGKLHKLDFLRTMHRANSKDFKDDRLVKIFDRYATYNGSSPYKAPATLNMIAHLENNLGAFFPEEGMYGIVRGLYGLACRQGVRFRFSEQVQEIIVRGDRAVGVRCAAGYRYYDLVVSDADVKTLSRTILQDHPLRKRLQWSEPSSSALIFYWKVNREFESLDLHNIFFSGDYKKEFDTIFRRRTLPGDPTVYIFISSKVVPGDAPRGCENWFVMINAPSDSGQDWNRLIAQARTNIISKINNTLGTDIERYVEGEHLASPRTIERDTLSAGGALYGTSSNSMLSAFMRHPNTLSSYQGLYFVGGSVHPGGGIPLCLASSAIVCEEIKEKYADRH